MNEWLILLLVGFLPTEVFRWLGVFFSKGLDEKSAVYQWVKAVATATLAAVVAKLIFFPSGDLAQITVHFRLFALICGLVAFYLSQKRVIIGVLTGQAVLFLTSYV